VKLFLLDPHTIYRSGLAACLHALADVESVEHAGSVRDAWEHAGLRVSDVVIVDVEAPGALSFVAAVREATAAQVIVCSSRCSRADVLAAVRAGAIGCLRKDTLSTESLASAIKAARDGACVLAPELLGALLEPHRANGNGHAARAVLTDREQQVLRLIAAGHLTREVAQQLCYSERTVKSVLHDIVVKLNARSRSQAIAHAVREGLI
jgi:DNA-binding NarL/FixJ family response regulator